MEPVQLKYEGWDVIIDAQNGSAFRSCTYQDEEVLRPLEIPTQAGEFLPFLSGHFPFVPFSNRIRGGRFKWDSHPAQLPNNVPGQAHPLHGHGLNRVWQVRSHSESRIELGYKHATGDWPWNYLARQTITAAGNVLRAELFVTNLSDSDMPCGLGFHPYFSDPAGAALSFESAGVWIPDAEALPEKWIPIGTDYDFAGGRALAGLSLDHCFNGMGRKANISWPEKSRSLELRYSENLKWAAVYISQADNCFCFEPVSHAHNALNMDDPIEQGIERLAPNETLNAWLEVAVI